jgi:hypothetical protein
MRTASILALIMEEVRSCETSVYFNELMIEAVRISETSVYFNETIRRYIIEDFFECKCKRLFEINVAEHFSHENLPKEKNKALKCLKNK